MKVICTVIYYTVVEELELQSLKETGNLYYVVGYIEYVTYFGEQIVG